MSSEDAYELLESIAIISGTKDKLKLVCDISAITKKAQNTKKPPVNFSNAIFLKEQNLYIKKMLVL